MSAETFWKSYVGEVSPADFMLRHRTDRVFDAARAFVSDLPHLFGIILRGTWADTLKEKRQLNREEVIVGLVEYLEETRPQWEESVAGYAVPEEQRFAVLQDDQVDAFLKEKIVFRGAPLIPMQDGGIDQLSAFKEMPFPKSTRFDDVAVVKLLVNAPTDQEIETRMQQKRTGVSNEVIQKYAAMVHDEDEDS